jgi:hypothetical protein
VGPTWRTTTMDKGAIIAESKTDVRNILAAAISGFDERYRFKKDFIRWGLVEEDINAAIDNHLGEFEKKGE